MFYPCILSSCWKYIKNILARFLFPTIRKEVELQRRKEYSKKRGAELREIFSVSDISSLKTRAARNYLEHFDKYLEEWIESTKSDKNIDLSWGSLDKIMTMDPDFESGDFLRYFDDKKFIIVFSKFSFELKPIIGAIQELLTKIEQMKPNTQESCPNA